MMPGNSIVKGMVARLATTGFVREALAEKVDLKAILFDNLFDFDKGLLSRGQLLFPSACAAVPRSAAGRPASAGRETGVMRRRTCMTVMAASANVVAMDRKTACGA